MYYCTAYSEWTTFPIAIVIRAALQQFVFTFHTINTFPMCLTFPFHFISIQFNILVVSFVSSPLYIRHHIYRKIMHQVGFNANKESKTKQKRNTKEKNPNEYARNILFHFLIVSTVKTKTSTIL